MSLSRLAGRREVMRGILDYRKKGSGSWKKRAVLVHCGSDVDGKTQSACIAIYDNYDQVEKIGEKTKKPKKVIQLQGAKIEEAMYASPVGSHGTSPSSSNQSSCLFLVILTNEVSEFRSDSPDTKVHWLKLLTLLAMFPYSPIPEEPRSNPISESFRYKLDPKSYGADSAWAVYIMPEDVSLRCNMIGTHILLLKGGVPHQTVGRLEIISPSDTGTPIVTWDRDKMRRTGKTGNLVFIEIGRRCTGGPGLVWMYAGFEEAHPLRETLHRFLFQGDGKPVTIESDSAYGGSIYSNLRSSSFDKSLPSSYQKEQSMPNGYQYHQVPSNRLREDSGFKDSPISHSVSPSQSVPPPIRLDKHPSFRKQRSVPCRVPRTGSSICSSPSGSFDREPSQQSYGHSVGSFNDDELFDERVSSRQSISPPDEGYSENDESGSGQFPMDPEIPHQRRNTEPPRDVIRVQVPQRSNTAPSCSQNYEKMVHPNAALYREDYIPMIPAGRRNSGGGQRPQVPSHYDVPPPFRNKRPNGDISSSTSPLNYENCGSLPTIEEAPKRGGQVEIYENFPRAIKPEEFVHYQPNYENMENFKDRRRNSETYENVPSSEERRASFRSRGRSIDKEDIQLREKGVTPPTTNMHFAYAERHTHSPVDSASCPPIPPRIPVVCDTSTTV